MSVAEGLDEGSVGSSRRDRFAAWAIQTPKQIWLISSSLASSRLTFVRSQKPQSTYIVGLKKHMQLTSLPKPSAPFSPQKMPRSSSSRPWKELFTTPRTSIPSPIRGSGKHGGSLVSNKPVLPTATTQLATNPPRPLRRQTGQPLGRRTSVAPAGDRERRPGVEMFVVFIQLPICTAASSSRRQLTTQSITKETADDIM